MTGHAAAERGRRRGVHPPGNGPQNINCPGKYWDQQPPPLHTTPPPPSLLLLLLLLQCLGRCRDGGGRRPTTGPRSNIFTWCGIKIFCPDPRNLYRGNIGRGGQLRVRVCFPPVSHGVTVSPVVPGRPGAPHLHHPHYPLFMSARVTDVAADSGQMRG